MIDTNKYRGHTSIDDWRMVFLGLKQMNGFKIEVYDLAQERECDYEDYIVSQANQDLAKDAPLLLREVKRLRKEHELLNNLYTNLEKRYQELLEVNKNE